MKHIDIIKRNKEILNLVKQGVKQKDVADRFNLAKSSITKILQDANYDAVSEKNKRTYEEDNEKCKALYGLSREQWEARDRDIWKRAAKMIITTRTNAKRREILHTLKTGDLYMKLLAQANTCPVFGYEYDSEVPDLRASVDRIDNNKGYTPDNIQIISYRANRLKSDATVDELHQLLNFLEN